MTAHPLTSWLFVSCLKTYRRPWLAMEIARTMFDDERHVFFGARIAKA